MTESLFALLSGWRLRVAIGGISLTLVCALGFGLWIGGAVRSEPVSVQWLAVRPQPLKSELGLVGRIDSAAKQTLSAPFDGIVQNLVVSEGQRVERGQKLLDLDTAQLDIQLRQASTDLLKAKRTVQEMEDWERGDEVARARRAVTNADLNLNDTEAKLADLKHLFVRGIVPRMEVQALEQQLRLQRLDLAASQAELRKVLTKGQGDYRRIADMELANAEARYASIRAMQAQRELRAPFAGIVLHPQTFDRTGVNAAVHSGQRVAQGVPLFEIVSLERVQAHARIEEMDLHQLREGMAVQVTGDGFQGLNLHGHVLTIGAQALASEAYGGSSYEVVVAIDTLTPEQLQLVRLGMSTRLVVSTYRVEQGFAVPPEVLRVGQDGSTYVLFRKSQEDSPRRVSVVPGRAVSQGIEVSGLEAGFVELAINSR